MSLLLLVSCFQNDHNSCIKFHDDGRAKAVVAFMPVLDKSSSDVGWSLADEFTDSIRQCLYKKNNFFISDMEKLSEEVSNKCDNSEAFGKDIKWIKETFPNNEFIKR